MYKVNLEIFEGPLDLLLFLIRKNEIDINDIPISRLTQEYVDAINQMENLDLNVAGEFLVMAAHLMLIKSRMMLPMTAAAEGEEGVDGGDPRSELVARLLEYKQFKEAAGDLHKRELMQREVFGRLGAQEAMRPDLDLAAAAAENDLEVNLFDLLKAFQRILDELPENTIREIEREEVSVVQKMNEILDLLDQNESVSFFEAFRSAKDRATLMATFLGMLELARLKSIAIRQAQLFGEIRIYKKKLEDEKEKGKEEGNGGDAMEGSIGNL
ncbi:MAG: segregation/condensation protein A [candidate division FCPU426 bacterium]